MTVPFQVDPGEGRAIWHLGALMQFKATGADTGGRFWLAEQTSAKGYASPLHRHTREDELFIILDGEVNIEVGGKTFEASPGSVTFAPRELAHSFQVQSDLARFLILTTPAGFEQWFFDTGEPAGALTVPPPPVEIPDIGRIIGALADYGVEPLAPPPGIGGPPRP